MKITKHYAIPALLIVLFLLPFLAAWWSYQSGVMRQAGLVNHGQLMTTAVTIPGLTQPNKKWQLVYVTSLPCKRVCMNALDTLARIRLALGRRLYGLELVLVVTGPVQQHESLTHQLESMDIKIKKLTQIPESLTHASVWLVNNEGKGVLTYQDTSHPKAIYADLKKLSELWAG